MQGKCEPKNDNGESHIKSANVAKPNRASSDYTPGITYAIASQDNREDDRIVAFWGKSLL